MDFPTYLSDLVLHYIRTRMLRSQNAGFLMQHFSDKTVVNLYFIFGTWEFNRKSCASLLHADFSPQQVKLMENAHILYSHENVWNAVFINQNSPPKQAEISGDLFKQLLY